MVGHDAPSLELSTTNLRRLFYLRTIEIVAQLTAVILAIRLLAIPLPLGPVGAVIGLLAVVNGLTLWRLKRAWPVTDAELFAQLLLDVAAMTVLLYFSGGFTNPLVSFYLVPLVITAITLPTSCTWFMALVTAGAYTWLMFYYCPLMPHCGDHRAAIHLHLVGMWLTFVLSAGLIAFFVVRMANAIRQRDRQLAAAREETLRNERIVALGTLAAGVAHELGTPLSTMAVVVHELQREHVSDTDLAADLQLLRDQVDSCKRILSDLLVSAGQARGEDGGGLPIDRYFQELFDKWRLIRPGVTAETVLQGARPAPRIVAEQTLSQALMNLLNNATDASPERIEAAVHWDGREISMEIRDHGPGFTPEVAMNVGKPFLTTKGPAHGLGIGLFLANATIERFGGKVTVLNREGGGAVTEVRLPLARLLLKQEVDHGDGSGRERHG